MGLITSRRVQRRLAVLTGLAGLTVEERRTVLRAASRGPVPTDVRLRSAAQASLVCRRDEMVRMHASRP